MGVAERNYKSIESPKELSGKFSLLPAKFGKENIFVVIE